MAGQKKKSINDNENHAEYSAESGGILSRGFNGFPEFAKFLLQNEEEPSDNPNRSSRRELALAAIEVLCEGDKLEADPDLKLIAIRGELDSWIKEIRSFGNRKSLASSFSRSLATNWKEPIAAFFVYPHLPAGEIICLDALTNGFQKSFSLEKDGVVCLDPDLHAAVNGIIRNEYTSLLREELRKIDPPSYLKRAFDYVDGYRDFWAKEFAKREKELGPLEGTERKIAQKSSGLEKEEAQREKKENFCRFLNPFYSHEEEKSWPWTSHIRSFDGDLKEAKSNGLLRFDPNKSNFLRAIYPLRKADGRYYFLVFVPVTLEEDEVYDFSYDETLSMDGDGKLLTAPSEGGIPKNWNWWMDPPVSAPDWGEEIEEECPSLFKTLEPFSDGEKLHELDYQEALENGLSRVNILLKGASPNGYFPLLNSRRFSFDDYGEVFYLLHKAPEKRVQLWRDGKKKNDEKPTEKIAAKREVTIEGETRRAFLIQVREEDIEQFYQSYYETLLKGEKRK